MIRNQYLRKYISDVTYGQVWWPILGICALHLTHPKCTHTAVNTHTVNTHPEQWTHTQQWTHTRSSGHLCCGARGAVGGSVPCSRAPQSWYWRWRESCTFTPPTYNSCRTWDLNRDLWVTSKKFSWLVGYRTWGSCRSFSLFSQQLE